MQHCGVGPGGTGVSISADSRDRGPSGHPPVTGTVPRHVPAAREDSLQLWEQRLRQASWRPALLPLPPVGPLGAFLVEVWTGTEWSQGQQPWAPWEFGGAHL